MDTQLNGAAKIRVLVVDDHPVVRDGVALLASTCSRIEVVGYAPTGKDAVDLIQTTSPHVVLLDLRLPDTLAPELICRLREWNTYARIIVFTAYPNHPAVRAALDAGACGVIPKDAARMDLVSVILGAVRSDDGAVDFEPASRCDHALVGRREYDVLRRVAIGETNREIAEAMCLSPNTVKAYLRNLMQKLDARNRVEAISRAREVGLL